MLSSKPIVLLTCLIVMISLITTGVGLFWMEGNGAFSFSTLRDEKVEIYGRGLYRYDSAFKSPILRGTDAVTLLVGLPFLVISLLYYLRDSRKGGILFIGALSCSLYNSASLAFGAAYNPLFLLYVAYFSASLFDFIIVFHRIHSQYPTANISPRMPYRLMATFIFIAGLSPCVWLIDVVTSLIQSHTPQGVASYTTDITTVLDVGIIVPAAILASVQLRRRKPLGYLLTSTLLILLTFIGLVVIGQTVMQILDGIKLSLAQFVTYVVPFICLGLVSIGLMTIMLRNTTEPASINPG